jgi:ketosteroid isomerase-like protein
MSQESVEIVRRWGESWARRDVPDLLACFNDEIEVDFSNADGPFRGIYRGRDDVIGFCRSLWEAWEVITFSFEAAIECGDDCLVTAHVLRAKGKASGINVEAHGANLWTFREGRISRCELFQTTAEALEAVGRSE